VKPAWRRRWRRRRKRRRPAARRRRGLGLELAQLARRQLVRRFFVRGVRHEYLEDTGTCRTRGETSRRRTRGCGVATLGRISQPKRGQGVVRPRPKSRHGPLRAADVHRRCEGAA
jgi:hypothetical protein